MSFSSSSSIALLLLFCNKYEIDTKQWSRQDFHLIKSSPCVAVSNSIVVVVGNNLVVSISMTSMSDHMASMSNCMSSMPKAMTSMTSMASTRATKSSTEATDLGVGAGKEDKDANEALDL